MAHPPPAFRDAVRFWLKLGLISFGGPSGQIAIMHAELVQKKKWIEEEHFLHALNFCMLLPGPEATQLAIYCGWLLHGTLGGIVAGTLFVLPAALLLWLLSLAYVYFGQTPWLAAAFYGVKPVVIALVTAALWRIGESALKTNRLAILAASAFVALFFFHLPFPVILAFAAIIGFATHRPPPAPTMAKPSPHPDVSWTQTARTLGLSLALWWIPVAAVGLWLGWDSTPARQGLFFSKAALVTFGGAYAVLPYIGQQAVAHYGWISTPQMLDGLGLAETTPGPLIMVLQFVGFLGGWQHPGVLPPLAAGTLGAMLTTWVTFVPTFLFIFAGAPYIERLRQVAWLSDALRAVTAAVVGVILNLAVWFGLHVLFPGQGSVDGFSLAIAVLAFAALHGLKANVAAVVLAGAGLGLIRLAL